MAADKTTNNYLVSPEKYKALIDKEIQKNYKKEDPKNVDNIEEEHATTIRELELGDRVFKTVPRNAYITLKDHKPDFQLRPSVRLINPRKPELGKIAMQILDKMVKVIRKSTHLKQYTCSGDVIDWFKQLQDKKRLRLIYVWH